MNLDGILSWEQSTGKELSQGLLWSIPLVGQLAFTSTMIKHINQHQIGKTLNTKEPKYNTTSYEFQQQVNWVMAEKSRIFLITQVAMLAISILALVLVSSFSWIPITCIVLNGIGVIGGFSFHMGDVGSFQDKPIGAS